MKQRSSPWRAAGFALVTFCGTILHFLYDWRGGSVLVSLFFGVNESTWEHMKLLFQPLLLFALVQRFFIKDQKNFWCVKLAEIVLGLVLIPVLFYTLRKNIPDVSWEVANKVQWKISTHMYEKTASTGGETVLNIPGK